MDAEFNASHAATHREKVGQDDLEHLQEFGVELCHAHERVLVHDVFLGLPQAVLPVLPWRMRRETKNTGMSAAAVGHGRSSAEALLERVRARGEGGKGEEREAMEAAAAG